MAGERRDILLVEDNPDDVELILRALRKHNLANHVQVLGDGAEALAYLLPDDPSVEPGRPQLILLDLKLPKVGGLEVLRLVKGDDRTSTIPVIVLTSSHEEKDLIDSYRYGVNSYVVKPVNFEDFMHAVAELGMYWLLVNEGPP
jgi:CheY-like chemotaxis protein